MRFARLTPLLPWASAFIITERSIFQDLEHSGREFIDNTQHALDSALDTVDDAISGITDTAKHVYDKIHHAGCDVDSWLEGSAFDVSIRGSDDKPEHPPHHGPPGRGKPGHGRPHHPPHRGKPNMTVYELINSSKYTTKLAKLINKFDDLVELLNGTEANYTIFAPTDKAFEKIPDHGHKPSKATLKKILAYHVSPDSYPAGRVLHSYTIPTLYEPDNLGGKQRLTVRVTVKGPTINFYSRIIAVNIFGTNGVVHGVDSILVPPPNVAKIIDLLPGEFSTLELALGKTGIYEKMNDTEKYPHNGGTLFAPSNFAFQKLGPKLNAFLFSQYGLKYLKAILEYHIVVNRTLYSDAFYDASKDKDDESSTTRPPYYHYDLPTLFDKKSLAVDVARYGPFIEIKINGFSRVTIHDGVASDGVIQVVSDVLIPPKNGANGEQTYWQGEELSIEELKERIEPFMEEDTWEL